jgi:hypothetical protein
MTLEKWADEERKRLVDFVMMWVENAKDSPDEYPMEMSAGEWDEQYRSGQYY